MKKLLFIFLLFALEVFSKNYKAPSEGFSLSAWKFESPTGADIKSLTNYSSKYFYLTDDGLLCFDIETSNTSTKSLNNELRNLNNWYATENHQLNVEMKMEASPSNYKLVIAQIYGINTQNQDVAPLIRVMVENGNLYAHIKKNTQNNDIILLKENIGDDFFDLNLKVQNSNLIVKVNNKEVLNRNVSFWTYRNYFKIGAYPQSKNGDFKVCVKSISVN